MPDRARERKGVEARDDGEGDLGRLRGGHRQGEAQGEDRPELPDAHGHPRRQEGAAAPEAEVHRVAHEQRGPRLRLRARRLAAGGHAARGRGSARSAAAASPGSAPGSDARLGRDDDAPDRHAQCALERRERRLRLPGLQRRRLAGGRGPLPGADRAGSDRRRLLQGHGPDDRRARGRALPVPEPAGGRRGQGAARAGQELRRHRHVGDPPAGRPGRRRHRGVPEQPGCGGWPQAPRPAARGRRPAVLRRVRHPAHPRDRGHLALADVSAPGRDAADDRSRAAGDHRVPAHQLVHRPGHPHRLHPAALVLLGDDRRADPARGPGHDARRGRSRASCSTIA